MILLSLFSGLSYEEHAEEERYYVETESYVENGLITCGVNSDLFTVVEDSLGFAELLNDECSHLVTGETCKAPCGKCDTVDSTDVTHTVVVREKCRNVGEASAVACVYHHDESDYSKCKNHVAGTVLDTAVPSPLA